MSKIKVVLLSSDVDPRGGWGRVTYELCCTLDERGDVAFDLYVPRNAHVEPGLPYVEQVHKTLPPWIGTFRHVWHWHRVGSFIWPSCILDEPDLIHSLVEFPFAILARALATRLRIPYGVTTQGTYGVKPFLCIPDRWFFKPAIADAAFVTAPSTFTAEAIRQVSGLDRPVQIIHNAVNFERFQQRADLRAVRKRFGLSDHWRVVLGVGALKKRKGFDVLIRAFQTVASEVPDAHLAIVGEGSLRPQLEELVAQLGQSQRVHLVGSVSEDELVALYQLCDLFAHLPVNVKCNFEGFGIVYLEAASCGKPVVGSRSGGVPDAVLDGETGLLVEEGDYAQAAQAILRLLRGRELAERLGANGREYARQHQWDWYADELVKLYHVALKR